MMKIIGAYIDGNINKKVKKINESISNIINEHKGVVKGDFTDGDMRIAAHNELLRRIEIKITNMILNTFGCKVETPTDP